MIQIPQPWDARARRPCPSEPLLHPMFPEMLWQLDHLSFYYLDTCKKICLNFPLCFWSGLRPVFLCSPTELHFSAKRFLSVSRASWLRRPAMHCARARGLCQLTPLLTPNTCCDPLLSLFFLALWRPDTHGQGSNRDVQKNISLFLFPQSHNIRPVTACRGGNKGISGEVQWFVIASITTVYISLLLKRVTFVPQVQRPVECVISVWLYHH